MFTRFLGCLPTWVAHQEFLDDGRAPSRVTTTLSPSSLESFPILESKWGFSGSVSPR
ncbi:hypothetical protein BO83DRAFT_381241 [Aspergillus eucalypticola CBS 122712]|uniref:Uncharacterized protein n=1 Tax=Aspergillus eucalypticola (strain CBS 122712 / IBT 29274) TaxID=1448314 RepID=A0A317UWC7_ASPEC|nr:uncharacterized protein BO83DRAFT_381241 [Aspergillus eucalypticola CBS 122712]PWY65776.1 hypothetical protein BO83DRAFT_381241 [Aspergillus eucalypticola CBS 122712]